jgi:hypothetical protein
MFLRCGGSVEATEETSTPRQGQSVGCLSSDELQDRKLVSRCESECESKG